jgi:tetratricopeptide (TPR) repeat protein
MPVIIRWRGNIQTRSRKFERASHLYSRAIGYYGRSARTYFRRGVARVRMSDFEGAIDDLSQAIIINPRFEDAYYVRVDAFFQAGRFEMP